jgi:hypothetical protein
VLRLLRSERFLIVPVIKYEDPGPAPAIDEVRTCKHFIEQALAWRRPEERRPPT